jgi:hypothetical protein
VKALHSLGSRFSAMLERKILLKSQRFLVESVWEVECLRNGRLLWTEVNKNLCTDQGLNALLNIMFNEATQITTWYVALFNTNTTILATHTYAVPGYTESTAYDEATRPAFVEVTSTNKSLSNAASKASFTMDATTTIYGAALVGGGSAADTPGDTAGGGTLYCASKFDDAKAVEDDDVLRVTITLTAADA